MRKVIIVITIFALIFGILVSGIVGIFFNGENLQQSTVVTSGATQPSTASGI